MCTVPAGQCSVVMFRALCACRMLCCAVLCCCTYVLFMVMSVVVGIIILLWLTCAAVLCFIRAHRDCVSACLLLGGGGHRTVVKNEHAGDIAKEAVSAEDVAGMVNKFKATFNQRALLPACASCGLRTQQECMSFKVDDLGVLKLSTAQINEYLTSSSTYQRAASVFRRWDVNSGVYEHYHLHPELITTSVNPPEPPWSEEETVMLCPSCATVVRPNAKLPELSLANGIDFGNTSRLALPALTPVERTLIGLARVYMTVYKITDASFHHHRFKGQCITFRHQGKARLFPTAPHSIAIECSAPQLAANALNATLPRPLEIVPNLKVIFVGKDVKKQERMRIAMIGNHSPLRARPKVRLQISTRKQT